ncbi:MAG: putative membrane protein YdjX (TVP38/TMEM64 family) [Candidatus Omnitrophota bacterium]
MNKKTLPKLIIVGLIGFGLIVLFKNLNIQSKLDAFMDWIPTLGLWAPIAFVFIYAISAVLFIPASALTLGAGAIFGVWQGVLIVSIASTSGAVLSFLIGRYFARDFIAKKVETNPKFKAIDDAVASEGWKIVGLTRLSPVFPFSLLNYGYGITKVSLKEYFLASWIGMLPGTIMYVYLGAIAGTLANSAERTKTAGEWALLIIGLLATIIVTVYITRIAKKAISQKLK